MLFWLFIIIGLIGAGLIVVGTMDWDSKKHHFLWRNDDSIRGTGWTFAIIAIIAIIISSMCFFENFIGLNARISKCNEQYEALTYKMESGACRDEFGLLSKEVIDEIQDWNEDVVYRQNVQEDFWIGIYYPNVYGQFKTIDYNTYTKKQFDNRD